MTATQDLYELGDAPEIGTVPKRMYASLIRRERYGQPVDAFRTEVVDGFEHVFARQVTAHGRPGDVLLLMSTSGRSA
ncbi:hypothetical protein ABT329_23200, partial [Streptomyces minutiscleroticus]